VTRKLFVLVAFLISLFSLVPMFAGGAVSAQAVRSSAQSRPSKQYTIEQFLNTVAISGASFSSDETRILVSSNHTGIWNVYSLAVTGGNLMPVTTSTTESTYAVSYFPHDDRILFTRDQGGNELTHLYVRTPDGQERDLTPGNKLKAAFAGWTHDGAAFYVSSNERDQRFFDLYRYDAKGYDRVLFYQNDRGYLHAATSQDGRWVALAKRNTTNDADIYLWDAATKAVKHISAHQGQVNYQASTFDPASKYLYYLTDEGSEFRRLRRYALEEGRHEEVQKADWDILFTLFSHNGRYRVTGINKDGRVELSMIETAGGRAVALPSIPDGDIRGLVVARSESKLAFYVNADRSPNDLHVLQIGTGNLTRSTLDAVRGQKDCHTGGRGVA
jgi:Tol biopolymer transport system component